MEATIEQSTEAKKRLHAVQETLYFLQETLGGLQNEVERTSALFEIGENTELSDMIQEHFKNPIGSVITQSEISDKQVNSLVETIVYSFLLNHKEIIHSAFKSKTSTNSLHFSVVLNDDISKNRNQILDFYDDYDLLNISERFPVYFQFVPLHLLPKIKTTKEYNLKKAV